MGPGVERDRSVRITRRAQGVRRDWDWAQENSFCRSGQALGWHHHRAIWTLCVGLGFEGRWRRRRRKRSSSRRHSCRPGTPVLASCRHCACLLPFWATLAPQRIRPPKFRRNLGKRRRCGARFGTGVCQIAVGAWVRRLRRQEERGKRRTRVAGSGKVSGARAGAGNVCGARRSICVERKVNCES